MYSHGGLYEGADETSFRGAFLNDCQDVLSKALLKEAWNHKFPEQAVSYGKRLLAAADAAEASGRVPTPGRTLLSRLGLSKERESVAIADKLDIARSAGRWFIFWGERGHPGPRMVLEPTAPLTVNRALTERILTRWCSNSAEPSA